MARLNSWFAPDVMHALGWALIHSLWQAVGVAALAAVLMGFSHRPSVRYVIATGALALMLAAPVATFFLLMKPAPALLPANRVYAAPVIAHPSMTLGVPSMGNGVAIALENSPKSVLPARFLSPDVLPSSLLPWLVGAWLAGVAFFSLRLAGGFLLLEHRRRKESAAPGPRILALCHELQGRLGLTRAIRYLECNWLQTPAVIGWLRPVVLLPVTALIGLSEEQLRAVIAHELAHIRRLDAFVNLFQILAETLLFYHPAVWWLSKRIRAERELACDEIAVSLTGNRLEYARVLTLMAEWETAPALAMAANRGPLTERVFHIMGRKPSGAGQRMLGLTGSVLFLAAALGAANALFGIAYPIPAAHAKESIKAVLVSSQSAVDRIARQVIEASALAPKDVIPVLRDAAGDKPAPDQTQAAAQPEKLVVPSPDLSGILPTQTLPKPTVLASNAVPPPSQPSTSSSGDGLLPFTRPGDDHSDTLIPANASELKPEYTCHNTSVIGRALSAHAILMRDFVCDTVDEHVSETFGAHGSGVIMNIELGRPADTEKMAVGQIVTIAGDFKVLVSHHVEYLVAKNAKVLYFDPFAQATLPAPAITFGALVTSGFRVPSTLPITPGSDAPSVISAQPASEAPPQASPRPER